MFENLAQNASKASPLTLADLMFEYDRLQHINPTLEELREIIDGLSARGLITGLAPGIYRRCVKGEPDRKPTRLTQEIYENAAAEKHRWSEEQRRSST